jgi:hypothetical protein
MLFVLFSAWIALAVSIGNTAFAQSSATLFRSPATGTAGTPANIQYGSLGVVPADTALNGTAYSNGFSFGSPYYVAQNTSPAPVSLTPSATLPGIAAPTVTAPIALQPFDPYARSASPWFTPVLPAQSTPTSVLGNSSSPNSIYSGNFEQFFPETYQAMRKFREATRFDYTHLPGGNKPDSFGFDQIDLRMQLAFPCRLIPNNNKTSPNGTGYFLVAPGMNLVWWNGPKGPPDMPPNGFGAYLDLGMQPQLTENFGLNTWFRFGIFSDFKDVNSDAWRFQGRLEGIYNMSPEMQLVGGIICMDRARVRLMPTVGVIWTPRDDLIVRMVFPNPKVSKRLHKGTAEWWGYVQADYGGGAWNVEHLGKTDYNDIQFGAGIEFETLTRVGGYFEFGGAFARELYSGGNKWASPPTVLYLKTGFVF